MADKTFADVIHARAVNAVLAFERENRESRTPVMAKNVFTDDNEHLVVKDNDELWEVYVYVPGSVCEEYGVDAKTHYVSAEHIVEKRFQVFVIPKDLVPPDSELKEES